MEIAFGKPKKNQGWSMGATDRPALFAWVISHQPAVVFSQNKLAPAIRHLPNEQAVDR
jgi:hypothetical protein